SPTHLPSVEAYLDDHCDNSKRHPRMFAGIMDRSSMSFVDESDIPYVIGRCLSTPSPIYSRHRDTKSSLHFFKSELPIFFLTIFSLSDSATEAYIFAQIGIF